ncbi:MAG: hypothetical protein DCC52_15015 [Chloroflexi bacterium]|nr:MAG: hypothetical protein DCC52_15015 [Chloroflexota bacterium]
MAQAHPVERWHEIVRARSVEVMTFYLAGALQVLGNDAFHYVREIVGEHDAVLEFETLVDGLYINGVDLLRWNDAGQLIEFKVMLRPLKANQIVQQKMAELLDGSTGGRGKAF